MTKAKVHKHDGELPNSLHLKNHKTFVMVWNDVKSYPTKYDLERRLNMKIKSIYERARKYEIFRNAHPALHLPELVLRRAVTGGIIAVPEGVLRQIDRFRADASEIQSKQTIVVTGCQYGANLNRWFWKSLMNYERERGAKVYVLPIKYGNVTTVYQEEIRARILTSTFPDELEGRVIFDDVMLCGGELQLNVTRMRPTLERFLTDTICEMGGSASQIFAAPKLELEHRPRIGRTYPKSIMTTGACHHPSYMVDNLGQQDRTAEVATDAHNFAAIVIEIDNKTFHFRQLHADKKGRFYDINPEKGGADYFTPDGVKHRKDGVCAMILGDWHTGKTDQAVRKATFGKGSISKILQPKHIGLHDFVDCDSVSPHEIRQASRRAYKGPIQHDSLEVELHAGVAELKWIHEQTKAQIHVFASNHNEYVTEFVETGAYHKDNANYAIGIELHNVMVQDLKKRRPSKVDAKAIDPVVWWFRTHAPFVYAHERQDEVLLPQKAKNPILCSMHGDIGPRGMQTRSTKSFFKMNARIILGHNHSAQIWGEVWRVGTSTPLKQFYVTAPATDWTNTHCLIFDNGQRQLINIVNGRWYSKSQWH